MNINGCWGGRDYVWWKASAVNERCFGSDEWMYSIVSHQLYHYSECYPVSEAEAWRASTLNSRRQNRRLQCNGISYNPEGVELHVKTIISSTPSGLMVHRTCFPRVCTRSYSYSTLSGLGKSFVIIVHGLYPWLFKVEAFQASAHLIIILKAVCYDSVIWKGFSFCIAFTGKECGCMKTRLHQIILNSRSMCQQMADGDGRPVGWCVRKIFRDRIVYIQLFFWCNW